MVKLKRRKILLLKRTFKLFLLLISAFLFIGMPASAAKRFTNKSEVASYLQKEIVNRKKDITFEVSNDEISLSNLSRMIDVASKRKIKNNTSSGDYLYENLGFRYYSRSVTTNGSEKLYSYNIHLTYLETLNQTKIVDRKVQSILKKLKIDRCSTYEKIKKIAEWIVRNIQYDYSYESKTAYNALRTKRATCMGYGLLASKLFSEAGIQNRIITGDVKPSGGHMWNAVKLKGRYYYVDTCWMDSYADGRTSNYNHFLFGQRKCNKERIIGKSYKLSNVSSGYYRQPYRVTR